MNNISINMGFMWVCVFVYLVFICLGVECLDHMITLFSYQRNLKAIFQIDWLHGATFLPAMFSSSTFVILPFFMF